MNKLKTIEISFGAPVDLPEGLDRILQSVVGAMCKAYEADHHTRVMWLSGGGSRPRWSQRDAAFLGLSADPSAPETGEPTFDDSTYYLECAEREDYYGENPLNPDHERLRAAVAAKRLEEREQQLRATAVRRTGPSKFEVTAHRDLTDRELDEITRSMARRVR